VSSGALLKRIAGAAVSTGLCLCVCLQTPATAANSVCIFEIPKDAPKDFWAKIDSGAKKCVDGQYDVLIIPQQGSLIEDFTESVVARYCDFTKSIVPTTNSGGGSGFVMNMPVSYICSLVKPKN
jgi:hypothetical protein